MRLENRKVIITGAAQGMGGVITRKLADEGAELFLTARSRGPLEELAAELKGRGVKVDLMEGDCTVEKDVKAVVGAALKFFGGRIDVLVNAAGATGPIETPVWELDPDDFLDLLRKNIVGPFLPMKHVLPTMIKQRYGKIVNLGGGSGMRGYRYRAAYSASKWGVRGLTRTAAIEVGEHNINVNAIMPGIVETPRMEKLCRVKAEKRGWTYEQVYEEYLAEMPLHRVTYPEDIANAVVFLSCDDTKNITGQEMVIDGGWCA
ncbi:SDR family NAD(P)-dependent oxidoreductase [Albidovulum sp.]|uniref:SDR family NAD(P)-dependent oxidoreductase n=1 Tax=Albidovulum sp. TaxID=1872424 RepID=UPI0039B94851